MVPLITNLLTELEIRAAVTRMVIGGKHNSDGYIAYQVGI